jgi:non-ribosomal peptide synthetase component F
MAGWLNLGQILKVNAKKFPHTVALKDCDRGLTYPELNRRVNKLAHSLLALGLKKGDKIAVLLENSIEIIEAFLAAATPAERRALAREAARLDRRIAGWPVARVRDLLRDELGCAWWPARAREVRALLDEAISPSARA